MEDPILFLKIYGTIIGVTLLVAMTKSITVYIIFAIVVFILLIYISSRGGGGGDGGLDGHNY